mmetsp:Transcript_32361/g.37203  ORF Transcript_32361/g.37203 Transcript_32361/m.37203 type:complete len:80 (+) Transcript_32361:80-319(+)
MVLLFIFLSCTHDGFDSYTEELSYILLREKRDLRHLFLLNFILIFYFCCSSIPLLLPLGEDDDTTVVCLCTLARYFRRI